LPLELRRMVLGDSQTEVFTPTDGNDGKESLHYMPAPVGVNSETAR